jgi:hypothetical protein
LEKTLVLFRLYFSAEASYNDYCEIIFTTVMQNVLQNEMCRGFINVKNNRFPTVFQATVFVLNN